MMVFDVAAVEDRGSYWKVVNVFENRLGHQITTQESTINLSYMAAKMVKDALLEGKAVHIPKPYESVELLPGEFEVLDDSKVDPLDAAKKSAMIKVRMLVTPELAKISGLSLYGFTVLNNDLASNGYFITNENREEKYLEILETGNEKLIAKLEDYLNYKDEIENVAFFERQFSAFLRDIKAASEISEVQAIEEKFLSKFYANF